jgi:SynChlorMet cassette protein ScmD
MLPSRRLRANPDIVLRREFDDLALLFNPATNKGFGLDETGLVIWEMLDGKNDVKDFAAELGRRFASVPEDAESDVEAFLEELVAEGLAGYELG